MHLPALARRFLFLSGWILVFSCRKAPETAPTTVATDPVDSAIRSRFSDVDAALQARHVKVLGRRWTSWVGQTGGGSIPEFLVDLAESPGLSTYQGLDSLGEALAALRQDPQLDLFLIDTARRVRLKVRFAGESPVALLYTDSTGYLPLPTPPDFVKGSERAVKRPGSYESYRESKDETVSISCSRILGINGSLFYVIRGFVDYGSMAGPHPLERWIDARTGREYDFIDEHTLFDKKTHQRIHFGPDTSSRTWRTVGSRCGSSDEPDHVWQMRDRDRRLQRLDLEKPRLDVEYNLDTTGLVGHLDAVVELAAPDSGEGAILAALATDSEGTQWLYRSTANHLFGERAEFPEPYHAKHNLGPRAKLLDRPNTASDTVLIWYSSLPLSSLAWNPSPGLPAPAADTLAPPDTTMETATD